MQLFVSILLTLLYQKHNLYVVQTPESQVCLLGRIAPHADRGEASLRKTS